MLAESQRDQRPDARLFFKASKAKRLFRWVRIAGLKFASRAKPIASTYYSLLSRQFQREERAVLCGLAKYHAQLQEGDANIFLMRRNVHRLEKGLLMQPRRPVFAKDFILDTVNVYRKIVANPAHSMESSADSLNWAYDVLNEYFKAVAPDPVLDHAREIFERCPAPAGSCAGGGKRIPYKRILDEHPVSFEQLKQLATKRRSVRWWIASCWFAA